MEHGVKNSVTNAQKTHFQKLISNACSGKDIFDNKPVTNGQKQEVFSNQQLHY